MAVPHSDFGLHDARVAPLHCPILHGTNQVLITLIQLSNLFCSNSFFLSLFACVLGLSPRGDPLGNLRALCNQSHCVDEPYCSRSHNSLFASRPPLWLLGEHIKDSDGLNHWQLLIQKYFEFLSGLVSWVGDVWIF